MGCGVSKLEAVDKEAAGIKPLLRRRLEEMKKRSHASVLKGQQTMSKKELLKYNNVSSEEDETEHHHGESSVRSAKVAPAPPEPEEHKEVIYEEKIAEENGVDVEKTEEKENEARTPEKEKIIEIISAIPASEKLAAEEWEEEVQKTLAAKEEEEDVEEQGRPSDFDESLICPGSPSFRIYCVYVSDSDKDEAKDGESIDKTKRRDCRSDGTELTEGSSAKKSSEKRPKKGSKLRRALQKAGSAPSRYFCSVKGCYTTGGCMGPHHTRLHSQKCLT